MKKLFLLLTGIFFLSQIHFLSAQGVAINSDGSSAASTAILDVSSTTKGILIPRMTSIQMNNISSPANGMIVYNTTDKCLNYYTESPAGWHSFVVTGMATEINIGTNPDFITIEADGTLEFNGTATGWEDLMIPGFSSKANTNSPTFADFVNGTMIYYFNDVTSDLTN